MKILQRTIYVGGYTYRQISAYRTHHKRRNVLFRFLTGKRVSCKVHCILITGWCLLIGLLFQMLPISWLPHAHPSALDYLKVSRSLKDYSGKHMIISEPSQSLCPADTPLLMLVNSAPGRYDARNAIRETWGLRYRTVFFVGLQSAESQPYNRTELLEHADVVVFRFFDVYQALTVKSCLMLQWAEARCPHAAFVMKIDDDVLVNPWRLEAVLREHEKHDLVGYKHANVTPHRDPSHNWYVPHWLYPAAVVPEYLSGAAYLIRGKRLGELNRAAYRVPLMNMEDIYVTYLVGKGAAGLTLHHDRRLSRYKPLIDMDCAIWQLATVHGYDAAAMRASWKRLRLLATSEEPCATYEKYFFFMSHDLMLQ